MSKTFSKELGKGWFLANHYRQLMWGKIILIHEHAEGSITSLWENQEECPGCGENVPESYQLFKLLQELNHGDE